MKHKILGYTFIGVIFAATVAMLYHIEVKNGGSDDYVAPIHQDKTTNNDTVFCGGIAGLPCPTEGYLCEPEGNYPDAGTNCRKDETAGWKTYTNAKNGFEFEYPIDWFFETSESGDNNGFTDIHLTNYQVEDRADCSKFVGMELQAYHNYTGTFDSFVKSSIVGSNRRSGNLTPMTIGGQSAYRIDNSGWDVGCGSPGYFIKATENKYIYIFSGRGKEVDQKYIDQILSTFKFTN